MIVGAKYISSLMGVEAGSKVRLVHVDGCQSKTGDLLVLALAATECEELQPVCIPLTGGKPEIIDRIVARCAPKCDWIMLGGATP